MSLQTSRPSLDALVEEIAGFRPLPPIAAQVLQIAEEEHFSAHTLAQAISSDPALHAHILRVANSASFGAPCRIATVRDAVAALGFRRARATALVACAQATLPGGRSTDLPRFWRHATLVGLVAELLARATRRHEERAFTAGLLHGIGRLALGQVRPRAFGSAVLLARHELMTLHDAQEALLGFNDAELGGALARAWSFPLDLSLAIAQNGGPLWALDDRDSLAGYVVRAREFVAERGVTDGVEPESSERVSCGATAAAVGPLIELGGGFEALVGRAATFIEHSAVGSAVPAR